MATNNDYWVFERVIIGGLCTYKWWETLVVEAIAISTLGQVIVLRNSLQSLVKPKTLRLMLDIRVYFDGDYVEFIHGKNTY